MYSTRVGAGGGVRYPSSFLRGIIMDIRSQRCPSKYTKFFSSSDFCRADFLSIQSIACKALLEDFNCPLQVHPCFYVCHPPQSAKAHYRSMKNGVLQPTFAIIFVQCFGCMKQKLVALDKSSCIGQVKKTHFFSGMHLLDVEAPQHTSGCKMAPSSIPN